MSTYRNTCDTCDSAYETEGWEPGNCPLCEVELLRRKVGQIESLFVNNPTTDHETKDDFIHRVKAVLNN